jgi:hypothetical protein
MEQTFRDQLAEMMTAYTTQELLEGLVLAIIFGMALAWHYQRFAQVLSNKSRFARIFVLLAVTTFLVISVVKTSLTLSLGLVGALSIIRFRTPIKEPEELAYLFLTIAVGVGLGANQRFATTIVIAILLLFLSLRGIAGMRKPPLRTVCQVSAPLSKTGEIDAAQALKALIPAVEECCRQVDLRRVDSQDGDMHCSLLVEFDAVEDASRLIAKVEAVLPGSNVSLIEREGLD